MNAFNPYQIWWMVVLVAGVSYIGYFAIKLLGTKRGVFVTGVCGGLVSSTAVALDLAALSGDEHDSAPDVLAAGVTVAGAMMFPRILAIVAVAAPLLAERLAAADFSVRGEFSRGRGLSGAIPKPVCLRMRSIPSRAIHST